MLPFSLGPLLLLLLGTASAACTTDADCNLLGSCDSGACSCDTGWAGADCATLSLLPPAPLSKDGPGSYIAPDDYSSWGMSVVKEKGEYHGFVSEFLNGCSLDSWGTNSFVRTRTHPFCLRFPELL